MVIPSGIFTQFNETVDAFINDLGKTCTIVYPPKQTACINCITDTTNGKSSNVYKAGGPVAFPAGMICPWCNGVGIFEEESSESIRCNVYWNPKDWIKTGVALEIGKTYIQIRAFITDLPKLQRCTELRVHAQIADYGVWRFKRFGEMVPHGLGIDRYTIGFWQRVG